MPYRSKYRADASTSILGAWRLSWPLCSDNFHKMRCLQANTRFGSELVFTNTSIAKRYAYNNQGRPFTWTLGAKYMTQSACAPCTAKECVKGGCIKGLPCAFYIILIAKKVLHMPHLASNALFCDQTACPIYRPPWGSCLLPRVPVQWRPTIVAN